MTRSISRCGVVAVVGFGLVYGCQSKETPGAKAPAVHGRMQAFTAAPVPIKRQGEGVAGGVAGGVVGGVVGGIVGGSNEPSDSITLAQPSERKLIRDVKATVEVKSLEKALDKLRGATAAAGGYIASEGRSRDERGVNRAQFTLRIAAAKLDTVVATLSSLGTIEQLHSTASDITEEYFDLELRLANQRRLQARLLELLNRPGNRLSDLIEAERELARVSGEIERMEGRRRFWDNRVAFSTLAVTLHEPLPAVAGEDGGALAALGRSFSQAADNFIYAIAGVIAFTGGLSPVVGAVLIALWIVSRLWRLRKRARASAANVAPKSA